MKLATVGEPTTIVFHAIDRYGKECRKQVTDITGELVSCTDMTTTKCQVRREGESVYKIQYQPATRGKHQLHIKINGKSIKGSPYTVVARPSLQSLGKPVRIIGNIKDPTGIATNSKGEIIVIEGKVQTLFQFLHLRGRRFDHLVAQVQHVDSSALLGV